VILYYASLHLVIFHYIWLFVASHAATRRKRHRLRRPVVNLSDGNSLILTTKFHEHYINEQHYCNQLVGNGQQPITDCLISWELVSSQSQTVLFVEKWSAANHRLSLFVEKWSAANHRLSYICSSLLYPPFVYLKRLVLKFKVWISRSQPHHDWHVGTNYLYVSQCSNYHAQNHPLRMMTFSCLLTRHLVSLILL